MKRYGYIKKFNNNGCQNMSGYIRDMRTNNGNILQPWDFGNLIS